jgi:hypothetical protein
MTKDANIKTKQPNSSNWLEIKKALKYASERDLLGLVGELYLLSKANKDFLEARFVRNQAALDRYKAQIKKHLAPSEPWKDSQKISLKDAKKPLSDYRKATSDKIGLIELMVYYVECGTDFLCEFGDMYESYYMSLESVFDNALKQMKQFEDHEIDDFIYRLKEVVRKANHMGWGYYDSISDMLKDSYPNI